MAKVYPNFLQSWMNSSNFELSHEAVSPFSFTSCRFKYSFQCFDFKDSYCLFL